MSKTVTVDARKYQDEDDCLSAAERDAREHYGLAGWDLHPRWEDDQREHIVLTLPDYMG
jgi:hypothetical protein